MTPGRGHFGSQGHYLNQLGRGLLGDPTYQISALGLVVSDKKIFHVFPITLDPGCKAIFGTNEIV